jgi:serine/threonine protein kinase
MVGKKILHYQLIDKIGAGGMGEIYKAQDSRLNRLVAVKILSPGLSTDPDRKRRFFQEAQAASALNHPNIITLYDIASEGDMQCIVMEYISGKTLRDLTPAGGLTAAQSLQYATQIASALTAAHAAGIIHRDLKPSNIMVTTSGLIKVLDFGLAKWVDSGISGQTGEQSTMETALTREGSIIGTVSYMSPEQAEGKRVDARSDIFSFGSVLYEMLTGKRAFEGRSGISTLSAILRDDVKPINQAAPDVPPLLEQIVLRCLYKEPSARWQSMKDIEAALLTLQRQLDPEGHFASPFPTGPATVASTPAAPPSIVQAAVSEAAPAPLASVSTGSAPSIESPSPASVAPPVNGPVKTSPAGIGLPPNTPSTGAIQQPPAARKQGVPRSPSSSAKMLVAILGLIGAVLVAGAGVGGWFWWKSHQASPQPVATAAVPTPSANTPAPAEPKPSPLGNPPADQPPPEVAAPAAPEPVPVPGANDVSKSAKPKRTPKPKPDTTPKIVPPIPAPVAPVQPPPAPVAAPPPPPPKPAPPKPEVQTPVMVSDALPFVLNLAEDVPADAPEGQALHFTVREGLQVGDKTVIAKGATVTGAVAGESGKKGFLGMGGRKLTFRLTQAEAVDGRKLAVRAMAGKSADGPTIRPFDTGKASKSKGYAALQGTVYIAYIDGDQIVAVHK